MRRGIPIIVAALAVPGVARADGPPPDGTPVMVSDGGWEQRLSYLWDGGAVPFLWGAIAGRLAIDRWVDPPATPRLFSADEGGMPQAGWETPGWVVTATGGVAALAIAASGKPASWYHVKGLAEALATGCLITAGLKVTFGRHRPDYTIDDTIDGTGFGGEHRSFPSGHSTQAFAIATYSALFLRGHVFDGFRWWHGAVYAGIYGAAGLVAGERVYHHRHHLTDVAAGAAFGTATSALFFWYQERRLRHHTRERSTLVVTPAASAEDVRVQLGWTF